MSRLTVCLPDSIHRQIKELAKREGVSVNQFISSAVTEKVSAILTEDVLEARAAKAKEGGLKRVLDKVPNRPPVEGDEL